MAWSMSPLALYALPRFVDVDCALCALWQRINRDRPIIVGYSAVGVTLGSVSVATVAVGDGILRLEPDCLIVVGDGAVNVAPGLMRITAVVVDAGKNRSTISPRLDRVGA